jgi:hypothetical protein
MVKFSTHPRALWGATVTGTLVNQNLLLVRIPWLFVATQSGLGMIIRIHIFLLRDVYAKA